MLSVITILVFVALLAVPGFYIITRKMFPRGSKKASMWLSVGLTALLLCILLVVMSGAQV